MRSSDPGIGNVDWFHVSIFTNGWLHCTGRAVIDTRWTPDHRAAPTAAYVLSLCLLFVYKATWCGFFLAVLGCLVSCGCTLDSHFFGAARQTLTIRDPLWSNGHKVVTYQSTRECLLGSPLNSAHMKLAKITQCPAVHKAGRTSKSIQRLDPGFLTGTPPFSRSPFAAGPSVPLAVWGVLVTAKRGGLCPMFCTTTPASS